MSISDILRAKQIRMLYQPIVDLDSGTTIGYEALARGPEGSALEAPAALFAAAARENRVAELDRACSEQAIITAAPTWNRDDLLFVNVEPAWLEFDAIHRCAALAADLNVQLVVELTERALTARPREVLEAVRWLREQGIRIALDDVGADHRSLALMPFLSPDIVKLDRAITQAGQLSADDARVVNAVAAEAERAGSLVLAEGIEIPEHVVRARATGARLGQGWRFGHPTELTGEEFAREPTIAIPRCHSHSVSDLTPFELIAGQRSRRQGDKRLLLALSRQLEREAETLGREALVVATFQHEKFFTTTTKRRYERLARGAALVGALGAGLPSEPASGVRGASLESTDPLVGEWDVMVVSPHFAGAFVAKDLGDSGADMDRRFDFVVTYDRPLVIEAARTLLRRVMRSN